ncbi:MAG: AraC family transcriptional regulator [Bacteroidota bacterium]
MKVTQFDEQSGLYEFQFDQVHTELHSHPAVELIFAEHGVFSVITEFETQNDLSFSVVMSNQKHALVAEDCLLKVLMIEHQDQLVSNLLADHQISPVDGFVFSRQNAKLRLLLSDLSGQIMRKNPHPVYDDRVIRILDYIRNNEVSYDDMMAILPEVVHLSESRLSHLFKQEIGLSLKKYLIWDKLKKTIKNHLDEEEGLMESLIKSGFYDQPHFIRAFKTMMGISPAKVYNSRIVQSSKDSQ